MASKDWVSAEKQDKNSDQIEELIPNLRFNEFHKNWFKYKIKEIGTVKTGKTPSTANKSYFNNGNIIWVTPGDISNKKFVNESSRYLTEEGLKKSIKLPKNAILVTCIGATIGKICMINKKGSCNQQINAIIPNEKYNPHFIYYVIEKNSPKFKLYAGNTATPIINKKFFENLSFYFPSINEQNKIGKFLSLIDKKIELMEKKYDSLKLYKKGFIQQIFSQEIRFKNSENMFSDWKNRKLSDFLFEHKLKSTDNEEVYSVSVHKGLVNQIEHLGRDFSSKNTSKYNLVKPGDIVYTKSPTGEFPLGIIKQSRINKDVIVSPLYGVFSPETFDLGYILNEYFESEVNTYNYLHPIVQKGAKNTMNISNKTFLSKTLFVPTDKNEQKLIHTILAKINKKIDSVEQQLEKIKEFKKYLLQQMFV